MNGSSKEEVTNLLTNNNESVEYCDEKFNSIGLATIIRRPPRRCDNNGLSENQALTNLIKGLIGTGILSLPMGFLNAGLLTGLLLLLFINFVNIYCMHQLVSCSQKLCHRIGLEFLDYGGVAEYSLQYGPMKLRSYSHIGKLIVNSFIIATQLGFCCVYFVFIATNLQQVFDPSEKRSINVFIAIVYLPMLLLCSIRDLKTLAIGSTLANILFIMGFGITFFYMFSTFHLKDPNSLIPLFNSWATLPLFFGTAMFAFEGISLILPIENKMRQPETFGKWNGVLNISCILVTVVYVAVGFFGYLRFGSQTQDSLTLNLPKDQILYLAVRVMFAVGVFLTYPVQFYVPMEVIMKFINSRCNETNRNSLLYEYLARFLMVSFTFLMAELIPQLSLFISLVGSITAAALALIFPPLIETFTFWSNTKGNRCWIMFKNFLILSYGFCGFIFGTYASISGIIRAFKGSEKQ